MVKLPFVAVAALSMIAVAVGCATPQIGSIGNGSDDDTGSATSNSTTTSGTTTTTDAGVTTTTPTLIPGTSACYSTCLGPASPAAAYEACRANCADAACETTCFNTSCAGANATTCNTAISTCQATCQGTGTTVDAGTTTPNAGARDCTNQCVAQTPAIQYWGCSVQNCGATPGQCDDTCFNNSICGQSQANAQACDTILQNCAQRCGDTLPQF